ncbi:MAG: DNA replication and repair protein RecF [Armatimonadota bacterium]
MSGIALTRLAIQDFRNLSFVEIEPAAGLNLLVGQNAQGKTSTLEAIHLASTGRLLRPGKEGGAIQIGRDEGAIHATVEPTQTEIKVVLRHGVRKTVQVNGSTLKRASDVLGRLPSVSFSSQDMLLVDGEPSDRRGLADAELSQLYPAYLRAFALFKRALDQRNSLLKHAQEAHVTEEEFRVWEEHLADAGEIMRTYRLNWLTMLEVHAAIAQERLGSGEKIGMKWVLADEGPMVESLAARRRQDIHRGSTGVGPHRDELEIKLDSMPAKTHASQGQRRSVVIALKAAVLETAREVLGSPPLLLLDDVFSDLDAHRRTMLVEMALEQGGQVFITCTEQEQGGKVLVGRSAVFRVQSGQVNRER